MILRAGLVLASTLIWGGLASAQSTAPRFQQEAPSQLEPVENRDVAYFLVDASGSMGKNGKNQALPVLEKLLEELPASSMRSVTFFGGRESVTSPPYGCSEEIKVEQAEPKGEPLDHVPILGGDKDFTAIGRALEFFFYQVGDDASVTILSDGIEQCGADFAAIRNKYPIAEINFVPVPIGVRHPLELLNIKPHKASTLHERAIPSAPLATVTFNITRSDDPEGARASLAWNNAYWLEKYLWLIGYSIFAASGVVFGRRFDEMSVTIEDKIQEMERYRRKRAEQDQREVENEDDLPKSLNFATTVGKESPLVVWGSSLLLLATIMLAPMAFADGLTQIEAAFAGVVLLVGFVLLTAALSQLKKTLTKKQATLLPQTERELSYLQLPSGLGQRAGLTALLVTLAVLQYLFVDIQQARHAAWFVLGSNFSAALAFVASAPWLFFGARWWNYKRTAFTYHTVESATISAAIRDKRKSKLDWDSYRQSILTWRFPVSVFNLPNWSKFGQSRALNEREAVVQRLKEIAVRAGEELPQISDANDFYKNLLLSENLETLIEKLIEQEIKEVKKGETLWIELAKALKSHRDRRIVEAYSKLAVVISNT